MRKILVFLFIFQYSCGQMEKNPVHPSSSSSATPITGSLKYYNHYAFNHVYTLNLTIGGQTIETVIDTGSSNLLVIGNSKLCPNCTNDYGYSSVYTPTSTSKVLTDTTWSMNFAPIGSATVQGYSDTVVYSGQTLTNFDFGVVTYEKGIPNIWGIAYQQIAKPSGNPQLPLFDALVQYGGFKNQFSMRLCGLKKGSQMTLGSYDSGVTLSNVQWTPIVEKIWYSIGVKRMYIASSTSTPTWVWSPKTTDVVIVDSGTNPIVIPASNLSQLVTALQNVATQNSITIPSSFWPTSSAPGGLATISASAIAKFPNILLDVVSADDPTTTFTLTISPSIYIQTTENGQQFLAFEAGSSPYILGTAFMENYVVLHSRGTLSTETDANAKIGFHSNSGLCN